METATEGTTRPVSALEVGTIAWSPCVASILNSVRPSAPDPLPGLLCAWGRVRR
jgi:hypothetical protein